MTIALILLAALFLAYSNGANDNFKGVATLFGSGSTSYTTAIRWATVTTFLGCIAAIFIAQGLIKNFSGKGLIPDEALKSPALAIAVAAGAAGTVFLATKTGIPISTTHAIVGALTGAGFMAVGNALHLEQLTDTFLRPLLLSPLIACVASMILYLLFRFIRLWLKIEKDTTLQMTGRPDGKEHFIAPALEISREQYTGSIVGISAQKILDALHFLSAGAVGFARGLNDAPKIAGLLLLVPFLQVPSMLIAIAVVMAVGGLVNAKKVGETMSKKITTMNSGQGFTSNLVTAILVSTASISGLPVSTTHVSVGGIFGIGIVNKKADYRTISKILLSWVLTLPAAAILSALIYLILQKFIK